jgi:hypothetical protein
MTMVRLVLDPEIVKLQQNGQLEKKFGEALKKVEIPEFTGEAPEDVQSYIMAEAGKLYPYVGLEDQKVALRTFYPHISRIHQETEPLQTLDKILRLPGKKSIYRAITVGKGDHPTWTPDPDETKYPTDGWIGRYLRYARENEANLAFHFWAAMTIVGAIAQRKVYFEMGQFRIYLNSYTILTGNSSSGKSTASKVAINLLHRFNEHIKIHQPDGLTKCWFSRVTPLPNIL